MSGLGRKNEQLQYVKKTADLRQVFFIDMFMDYIARR